MVTNENNVSSSNPNGSNQQPIMNKQNKSPKKPKKGFWKHLGFSERLLFIVFSVFTVGVVAGVPLYTYVFNKMYTVTFDPDYEDAKVTTEQVKKDDSINRPTDPKRDGYGFLGWRKDREKNEYYNFSEKVTSDFTLYGTWGKEFTVTFDLNYEGSESFTRTVLDGKSIGSVTTPTRNRYVFLDWCTDKIGKNKFDLNTPVTNNMTLYANWRDIYTYKVTFDYNYDGAPESKTISIDENNKVTRPDDPKRSYYNFVNWYEDKECKKEFNFDQTLTGPSKDFSIYAGWDPVKYTATYYSMATGEPVEFKKETISMPKTKTFPDLEGPEKTHYNFIGWYTTPSGGEKYDFTKEATGDINLYSRYEIIMCKVTFDLNYETEERTTEVEVAHGECVTEPEKKQRFGYDFDGWYDKAEGGNKFSFSTPIETTSLTLYAHWNKGVIKNLKVKKYGTSTFKVGEKLDDNNFEIEVIFENGDTFPLTYDKTGATGYKVTCEALSDNFELPYTFVNDDLNKTPDLTFSYTYEGVTKSTTLKIYIVGGIIYLKPVDTKRSTEESLEYDYGVLNISNIQSSTEIYLDPNCNLATSSEVTIDICKDDGTEITSTKAIHYQYKKHDVMWVRFYEGYSLDYGSATIKVTETIGTETRVGILPLEIAGFELFEPVKNDNGNYDVRIKNNHGYVSSVVCSVPTRYIEKDVDDTMIITQVDGIVAKDGQGESSSKDLSKIYIPKGIKYIGDKAFYFQYELKNVVIEEGLTLIGKEAFYRCYQLKNIELPSTLLEIQDKCFANIYSSSVLLADRLSINLPNGLKKIGSGAFMNTYFVQDNVITIPNTVTHIYSNAFKGCGGTSVQINFASDAKTRWSLIDEETSEIKQNVEESELVDGETTFNLLTRTSTEESEPKGYANYIWYRWPK